MKSQILPLLLLVASSFHCVARAAELTIRPDAVLAVVTADFNDDGSMDRALLVASERDSTQVDLLIYLSASPQSDAMRLVLNKRDIAGRGALWGMQPQLETNAQSSLLVKSMNDAIGRNRWSRTLTLAYRNNEFVIAGFTHNERDTIDPKSSMNCDVNLLTGTGIKDKKPFKTLSRAISATRWSENAIPAECRL